MAVGQSPKVRGAAARAEVKATVAADAAKVVVGGTARVEAQRTMSVVGVGASPARPPWLARVAKQNPPPPTMGGAGMKPSFYDRAGRRPPPAGKPPYYPRASSAGEYGDKSRQFGYPPGKVRNAWPNNKVAAPSDVVDVSEPGDFEVSVGGSPWVAVAVPEAEPEVIEL